MKRKHQDVNENENEAAASATALLSLGGMRQGGAEASSARDGDVDVSTLKTMVTTLGESLDAVNAQIKKILDLANVDSVEALQAKFKRLDSLLTDRRKTTVVNG